MEIVTPKPRAKLSLLPSSPKYKNLNNCPPVPPIQVQLRLHRPEYKPPKPIQTEPLPKKPTPRPVTTTSDILYLMDSLKLPVPLDIYTLLIKECTASGDRLRAIELHEHVKKSGRSLNLPLLNRLLLMYVSAGCFEHARQLFDQMFVRDFNSWAIVIAGCVENGKHGEAVELFTRMLCEEDLGNVCDSQMGFSVSGILVCVLKACLCNMDFNLGMQVHGWLWKMGYSRSVALSSFLISFYGKLKCFEGAQSVFDQVRSRNTVLWTSRIVNFCSNNNFEGAVSVFKEMGREGVSANAYTFSNILKACGRMREVTCGRQVHANVIKLGLESNGFVQCALVDFYGKSGFLRDAAMMFETGRNKRNDACCNAMLTHYMQHGLCIEAAKLLDEMKMAGFKPCESLFNEVRFICETSVP